jgi:hypothetical protein
MLNNVPEDLKRALREKRVIPFVGAGVSMAVLDRNTNKILFPSWKTLLFNAAASLDLQMKTKEAEAVRALLQVDDPDYLYITRLVKNGLGTCWWGFLREQLDLDPRSADQQSLSLARAVWELGSDLVITTNFDRVLHWTCPRTHQTDLRIWRIEAATEFADFLRGKWRKPTIWHLHGSIDAADGVIFTPDSYSELYPADHEDSQVRYKAALITLRFLLASYTLLFIGFSLDDKYFRWQLEWMRRVFPNISHYALVLKTEVATFNQLNLSVTPIPFDDFGSPIVEILRSLGELSATREYKDASAQAVESLYTFDDQQKVTAILELVSILLKKASNADIILKQLSELKEAVGTDVLAQASVRVANDLEEDLSVRQDHLTTLQEEHRQSLMAARRDISLIGVQREQIIFAWRRFRDELAILLTSSFLKKVERLKDEIEQKIRGSDLSEGKVLQAFRPQQMADTAVQICKSTVMEGLAQWSKHSSAEVDARIEAFWNEVKITNITPMLEASTDFQYLFAVAMDRLAMSVASPTGLVALLQVMPFSISTAAFMFAFGQSIVKAKIIELAQDELGQWSERAAADLRQTVVQKIDNIRDEFAIRWDDALGPVEAANNRLTADVERSVATLSQETKAVADLVQKIREIRSVLE